MDQSVGGMVKGLPNLGGEVCMACMYKRSQEKRGVQFQATQKARHVKEAVEWVKRKKII